MKYQNGMFCYGVYNFEKYPELNVICTGFGENDNCEWIEGLAFDLDGTFRTRVEFRLPLKYKYIGNIYLDDNGPKLNLKLSKGE